MNVVVVSFLGYTHSCSAGKHIKIERIFNCQMQEKNAAGMHPQGMKDNVQYLLNKLSEHY